MRTRPDASRESTELPNLQRPRVVFMGEWWNISTMQKARLREMWYAENAVRLFRILRKHEGRGDNQISFREYFVPFHIFTVSVFPLFDHRSFLYAVSSASGSFHHLVLRLRKRGENRCWPFVRMRAVSSRENAERTCWLFTSGCYVLSSFQLISKAYCC